MIPFRTLAAAVLLLLSSVVVAQSPRPFVESIEPDHGAPEGGTIVTIRGKHLSPFIPGVRAPRVLCTPCPAAPPVVLIGGKGATVQSYTDEELVVRTPPSAGGIYDVQVSNAYIPFGGPSEDQSVVVLRAFRYGTNTLERLLVPVVAFRVHGAFGSVWATELVARNDNDVQLIITAQEPPLSDLNLSHIQPKSTLRPLPFGDGGAAFLLHEYVGNDSSLTPIAFNLRIRDLSRQLDSWGTDVPLVRTEDAFIGRPMNLLNIPFEPESRVMLRLYDLDGPTGGEVPVRVFDNESNSLLGSTVLQFSSGEYTDQPPVPGFASIDVKSIVSNANGVETVRVQVGEKFHEKRLWSLISVTDLETQQVTVITPK